MRERVFEHCAERVCAGTVFRFFRGTTGYGIAHFPRDTGYGTRDTGARDIGYGSSHFSRDHGILDMGFRIFRGTTGYHRIWDFAFFAGPRDIGYGISHFARDHGITPNPVQSRGGKKRGRR